MKKKLKEIQLRKLISKHTLALILLVGFLHGLLYVFITPPWWHHDEPGHYLVVRFIAENGYHPAAGEANVNEGVFKEELFDSLDRAGIFELVKYKGRKGEKLVWWVLAPQFQDPPLYYAIAAIPLRLLKNTSLELQVYALRLLSLGFFVLTLWVSWQISGILFDEDHPLRWLSTAFLALLPGFVNEMTIIGNTPLGVLFFALFLWSGAVLISKGFSWRMLLLFGASAIACYTTNNLTWLPVLISFPLVILFLPFRKRAKWLPWVLILSLLILIPVILFEKDEAQYWYKLRPSAVPIRQELENAPHGKAVFELGYQEVMRQRIPEDVLIARRGETLTLGFWAWASEPTQMTAPYFSVYGEAQSPLNIDLGTSPTFYTVEIDIPADGGRGMLQIAPKALDNINPNIYLDGILLVDGNYSYSQGTPQFSDANATEGIWAGQSFDNLLRNGSAEKTWLRPADFFWEVLPAKIIGYYKPSSLVTFQDWRGSSWYFKETMVMLNETFWGKFGQSILPMLGTPYIYQFLRLIGMLSLLGALGWGVDRWSRLNWRILGMMFLASVVIWGQYFLRGAQTTDNAGALIPWARYALPAFLPTVIVISAGLYALFRALLRLLGIQQVTLPAKLVLIFMGTLDIFALLTMHYYFYQKTQLAFFILFVLLFLALSANWISREQKIASAAGGGG